jgi:WD40 repeat protein
VQLSPSVWRHVDESIAHFVGREWVFERIGRFLAGPAGVFALCGVPGSGKTAVAAWLASASAGRLDGAAHSDHERGLDSTVSVTPGAVTAALFCRAGQSTLLDLAQQLSDQFSAAVPEFAEALRSALPAYPSIGDITVRTGDVAAGARVVGLRVALDALGAEQAFLQGVTVPLRRIRDRGCTSRIGVLVDALDEAPTALSWHLAALHDVHLVVTTRRDERVLAQLPEDTQRCDLIDDAPVGVDDVRRYVEFRLYGTRPEDAVRVLAAAVADAAAGNFLYALHVLQDLLRAPEPLRQRSHALDVPLPRGGLPGMYRDFLRRELSGDDAAWARRLRPVLAPLAVARGDGLDVTQLCAIAAELAGGPITRTTVRDVVRWCGQFLDGRRPDGPFRPYHQSFADFLTDPEMNPDWLVDAAETHAAVVAVLSPPRHSGWADWSGATEYVVAHLAEHAAAAGVLDQLIVDPGFLVHAEPDAVMRAFPKATAPDTRLIERVYRHAADTLRGASPDQRAAQLELVAHQNNAESLAEAFAAQRPERPWSTRWARWRRSDHYVVGRHSGPVYTVATARLDGHPIVVSGGEDGVLRRWNLIDGTPVGNLLVGHGARINALDVCELSDGTQAVISGGADRVVRLSNLADGAPLGPPLTGPTTSVFAVLLVQLGEARRLAAAATADGAIWRWDVTVPTAPMRLGEPLHEDPRIEISRKVRPIGSLTRASSAHGDPLLAAVYGDQVLVWDVDRGVPLGAITNQAMAALLSGSGRLPDGTTVTFPDARVRGWSAGLVGIAEGSGDPTSGRIMSGDAFASLTLDDGQRIFVAGDALGRLVVYSASDGHPRGGHMAVHSGPIFSVTTARRADGQELAVSGGRDGTVRAWRIRDELRYARFSTTLPVKAAASTVLPDGRLVAVTGGPDQVLRTWNLHDGTVIQQNWLRGRSQTMRGTGPAALNTVSIVKTAGDGEVYAVTGDELGGVRFWSIPECEEVSPPLQANNSWITGLALAEDADRITAACCGGSSATSIWDLTRGTRVAVLNSTGKIDLSSSDGWADVVVTASSAEGTVFVTGGIDGCLRRWTLAGEAVGAPIRCGKQPITALAVDDALVIGTRDGSLFLAPLDKPERIEPVGGPHRAMVTALAARRSLVVSGSEDQLVQIWDRSTGARHVVQIGSAVSAVVLTSTAILVGAEAGLALIRYPVPVAPRGIRPFGRLDSTQIAVLESRLGRRLPPVYRSWLGRTNGAQPLGDHHVPGRYFALFEQRPLLGVHPEYSPYDLAEAEQRQRRRWLSDDYVVIGVPSGGLLAVRVREPAPDTVVFLSETVTTGRPGDTANAARERHLTRLARDIEEFVSLLRPLDLPV